MTGIADDLPKTISVPSNPSGNGLQVNWLPADNGGANFNRWTQLSCSLPPGVGSGHVGNFYDETVS